ncbi:uncharacterized protein LOC118348307 [Juglans regia]|uniref:Uncharacterized protein LOC118348307 n=1 Tax=Juglans regia TaxID=51240 RepID=A0A6P9EP62_JUGRE|nr:uncharacterized protein LOC118348307 [Juglans regia]
MGKREEHSSPLTLSSSNLPTADILSSNRHFVNYTSAGYYRPLPAWLLPFPPYPDSGQYLRNIQANAGYPTPFMTTSSATSERVDIEEPPECRETDISCTSFRVEESQGFSRAIILMDLLSLFIILRLMKNVGYLTPFMTTSSATSERVDIEEPPECRKTDIPCTSFRVEESQGFSRADILMDLLSLFIILRLIKVL